MIATARGLFGQKNGREKAQNVIERGDYFQTAVAKALHEFSVPNMYADEDVKSKAVYPASYHVKPIKEQLGILKRIFSSVPSLNFTVADVSRMQLPIGAEGWFAIPRWEKIAITYGKATGSVLKIKTSEMFFHSQRYDIDEQLQQSERTKNMLKILAQQQGDRDILLIPAQFGIFHRGHSARRSNALLCSDLHSEEFGLGAFADCVMILTHPERMASDGDLVEIDCLGDDYCSGNFMPYLSPDRIFGSLPSPLLPRRGIIFGAWPLGRSVDKNRCSPTGFVLK